MTHAIGSGTANVTANMPAAEARIHGRTAFELNIARGELIRQALREWYALHRPELGARIDTIRRHHREIGSAALLVLFSAFIIFGNPQEIRRAPRRTRIEQEVASC